MCDCFERLVEVVVEKVSFLPLCVCRCEYAMLQSVVTCHDIHVV
jgi:hypothetical protein